MDWKIDIDSMPSYVRVETNGEASPNSFAEMWDEILKSEFWYAGLSVLMDNRKLKPLKDADALTTAAIEYFAKNSERIGKVCIATLTAQPENFKYARQFQYGIRLRGSGVALQIFSSEKQCVEWLDHYSEIRSKENHSATA